MTEAAQTTFIADSVAALAADNEFSAGEMTVHPTFDGNGYRIRHLAFGEGAQLRDHRTKSRAVIQVVAGRVVFSAGDDERTLTPGAIVAVEAGAPHDLLPTEPSRVLLTFIEP